MTARTIDHRALIDWFVRNLSSAQLMRAERQGVTESGELEWTAFERNYLMYLINDRCLKFGAPVVDMEAVMRIENSAVGHSDYTQKLAIRTAELVLAG